MHTRWRLVTSNTPGAAAAIGVFHLVGDVDRACERLGIGPVAVGAVRLRRFGTIDRGVAARVSGDALLLMPHAGPAVLRQLEAWLEANGVTRDAMDDPRVLYPEAASLIEARMLHALSRAQSPLAIDLLLDQPRRWEGAGVGSEAEKDPAVVARSRVLNRLIDPTRVVALGPPNIGKSSLLNALAGRSVALVADEPGTTRDHVGARIDFAGVVVDYIDAPGIEMGASAHRIDREAQELAMAAATAADMVLLCADARSAFLSPPAGVEVLRVGLRADLGLTTGADVNVSARTGVGIEILVAAVGERLVPRAAREDRGVWAWWGRGEEEVVEWQSG